MFAEIPRRVAEIAGSDLSVHLPIAATITGSGWDVALGGDYPFDGAVRVEVRAAPPGGRLIVRRPGWAGGNGHEPLGADTMIELPVEPTWWTTDHRVEGGCTAHVRGGPVVYCLEGVEHPDLDLRDLAADPSSPPPEGFGRLTPAATLQHQWSAGVDGGSWTPCDVTFTPYADWANRGDTTMLTRSPVMPPATEA